MIRRPCRSPYRLLLLPAALAACVASPEADPPLGEAHQTVLVDAPEGASLELDDGARVEIPATALAANAAITLDASVAAVSTRAPSSVGAAMPSKDHTAALNQIEPDLDGL